MAAGDPHDEAEEEYEEVEGEFEDEEEYVEGEEYEDDEVEEGAAPPRMLARLAHASPWRSVA